jgi:hypothetical protein
MSALSEDGPSNPQDPFHYAPRRTSSRPDLRLSAVSSAVGETSFDRPSRPELVRRAQSPSALSAELENAVFESLRRQMDPEVIPEPPGMDGRLWRRAWLGIGAAIGVAAIAAALFVTLAPQGDSTASYAAASSTAQDDATKPALAQFRSLIVANDGGDQAITHEQSERMLQEFMLWRQKAGAGEQARQ